MRLFLFLTFLINSILAEELLTLKTRDNINQRILINEPISKPKAVLLLFAGGKGQLKLYKEKADWKLNNFLIRSRKIFNENDFITISIDSPSKLKGGMVNGFRTSKEHLEDIQTIINFSKKRYKDTPVWLVGTSRGTLSATFNAIYQKDIQGLVITSPLSIGNRGGKSILDLNLENIKVPTLVLSHENDMCRVTPPNKAKQIYTLINEKTKKEFELFSGGNISTEKVCSPFSHHGFYGIEQKVVKSISTWIKNN